MKFRERTEIIEFNEKIVEKSTHHTHVCQLFENILLKKYTHKFSKLIVGLELSRKVQSRNTQNLK